MRTHVLFMFLCAALAACTTNPIDRGKELAAQVQVGTTTKADVLQLFGFPTKQKKVMSDGQPQEVWTYVYAGQGTAESNGLTVTFDEKGVVSAIEPMTQVGPSSGSASNTPSPVGKTPRTNR